ncbi:hypothetical protein [Streptomyces sp. enrichment culture]|uniref:hypothetical protein n=1 Tax=Streptomyces sp. enrichment culture TaxID=1795815 RepID=UPI003F54FE45
MSESTASATHSLGSGSGDSDSSGFEALGDGLLEPVGEALAEGDWPASSVGAALVEEFSSGAVSGADVDGAGGVLSAAGALAEVLGEPDGVSPVAYAAGAASSATGAITAVAAAAAMARRSFMNTSGSRAYRAGTRHGR